MKRSAGLQLGAAWRARNAPAWRADFNFGFRISDFGFFNQSLLASAATVQGRKALQNVGGLPA